MPGENVEYNIEFYEDEDGKSSTAWQLIRELQKKADKQSCSLLNSIYMRLNILRTIGTRDGMPNFRSIEGSKNKLWEIRIKHVTGLHRIFICAWRGNNFVILNHFIKKTAKTPPSQIKLADNLMDKWIKKYERGI